MLKQCEFVYDDYWLVVNNTILRAPHHLHELFTMPKRIYVNMWGFHRPITILTYWIDLRLFGPNPFGFHIVNLFWHTATALLVFVLLRELWPAEPLMAFGAAALFAVHPVHTEAVAWVSGRSEILATFWGLLAFWAHRRGDRDVEIADSPLGLPDAPLPQILDPIRLRAKIQKCPPHRR